MSLSLPPPSPSFARAHALRSGRRPPARPSLPFSDRRQPSMDKMFDMIDEGAEQHHSAQTVHLRALARDVCDPKSTSKVRKLTVPELYRPS